MNLLSVLRIPNYATYLFLILVWSLPVIVAQWLVGLDILFKRWKIVLPGILIPTLYLVIVDAVALRAHTWTINPAQSLNWFIPIIHVPIEEAVFFLVTNFMLVQGLVLMLSPEMKTRRRRIVRLLRGGPRVINQEFGSES